MIVLSLATVGAVQANALMPKWFHVWSWLLFLCCCYVLLHDVVFV